MKESVTESTEPDNINKLIQQVALLEGIAKKNMTKEAIARHGNLKIAHPETAIQAVAMIAQAAQLGQISKPICDEEFKALLIEIQKGKPNLNFKNKILK